MRTAAIGAAVALACFAAHPTRAQSVEYTDAISRQILLVNIRQEEYTDIISRRGLLVNIRQEEYTDIISRRGLLVNIRPEEYTDTISRRGLLVNIRPEEYTDTISRQTLLYLPPYLAALMDARKALAIAAGLQKSTSDNMNRLNIIRDGASASTVDMRDAVRLARMAMGLDP